MNEPRIFHICSRDAWNEAAQAGRYRGSALDRRDGFIHFSTADQVKETAALHLRGIDGLVLLTVDAAALGDALRWEESRDGRLFPHLYGDLPADAVLDVAPLPLADDGLHLFPPGL